jgi:hypothetical protein
VTISWSAEMICYCSQVHVNHQSVYTCQTYVNLLLIVKIMHDTLCFMLNSARWLWFMLQWCLWLLKSDLKPCSFVGISSH